MSVRKLSVVLDLDSGQFTTRIREANGSLKTLSTQAISASSKIDGVAASARRGRDAVEGINKAVWKLQLTLASATFVFGGFTASLVKTNAEAQRSMALLEGLSKSTDTFSRKMEAASDFRFLRQFAKTAPYDFKTLTDVFVKLKSAGIDPMAGGMKALVQGVAQFGGSSDILHRASIAIQQMAGKGTVSMEELRQQLGEAVPTAMKIMAKAAGKSVPELVKEVSKGNVMWKDVQDKFFAELERSSTGSMERLKKTLPGQTEAIKTNIQQLMLAIGGFQDDGTFAKGGFMSTLTDGAVSFNDFLTNPATIKGAKELGASLTTLLTAARDFATFITANADTLMFLGKAFLIAKGAEMAVGAIQKIVTATVAVGAAQKGVMKDSMAARAAQLSAALAHDKAAVSAADAARAIAVSTRIATGAIEQQVLALKQEEAAYRTNIALATAQRQAAARAVETGRGVNGQFVSRSSATSDRDTATRAMVQNRRMLTKVTGELDIAEVALARSAAGATIAQNAAVLATTRLSVASRVATIASRALAATFSGLLSLVGGPLGLALIAVTAAITGVMGAANRAAEAQSSLNSEIERSKEALAGTRAMTTLAATATSQIGTEATIAGGKIKAFAGEVGNAAAKLYELAEAKRVAAIADLEGKRRDLSIAYSKTEATTIAGASRRNQVGNVRSIKDGVDSTFDLAGAYFGNLYTNGQSEKDKAAALTSGLNQMKALDAELKKLNKVDPKSGQPVVNTAIGTNMRNNGEFIAETTDKKPGKGGKPKVTPDQRAQANIEQLNSTSESVEHLIMTQDEGSKAFDRMTGKMDAQATVGKGASETLRDQAAEAAKSAAKNEKAYGIVQGILNDSRENASNAGEAVASMGDSYDTTSNAVDKFDRKMKASVAEVMRLHPELAKSDTAFNRFNQIVDASKADFKIMKIAEAARQLGERLHDMQIENLDPNLSALNGLTSDLNRIKELRDLNKELADSDPRKAITAADLDAKETGYRAEHKRRIEADQAEETRSILEGLMTQDQAAKSHYDRELARIDALAKAGVMGTTAAEEAKAAVRAQYARDTESEAQRMLREWTDVSGQMKQLSGEWMSDFTDKMLAGKFSFKDFAKTILVDWLTTMAKAKMASAMSGLFDFAANSLMKIGSTMMGVPAFHTGVGPGGAPSMARMVDPRMFMGAPKFHDGKMPALGNHEMAAIIRKDEGVFTPEQMKAIGKGVGGGTPNVELNIINESGTALNAQQQGGPNFDGEKYVIDVIVDAASRPGRLRTALMQK